MHKPNSILCRIFCRYKQITFDGWLVLLWSNRIYILDHNQPTPYCFAIFYSNVDIQNHQNKDVLFQVKPSLFHRFLLSTIKVFLCRVFLHFRHDRKTILQLFFFIRYFDTRNTMLALFHPVWDEEKQQNINSFSRTQTYSNCLKHPLDWE